MSDNSIHGPNVVSLLDRLNDMAFPEVARLQAYWLMLRGLRPVPLRSEVDPRAIESSLEYAFILERIAPGLARFRLAGTHINDLIGMEVRGMPISAIFASDARPDLSGIIEDVFTEPAIAEIELVAERSIGKPPMDGRLLLMPLKSDFGDVTRILGCLVTRGAIGRTPRRFTLGARLVTPVGAVESPVTMPGPRPAPAPQAAPARPYRDRGTIDPAPGPRLVEGFGEPPAGYQDAPRPPRREKPRLFVIRDNDKAV